jgi:hypothetical protein
MRNLTQDNITQAVIARLADTPDPRLKEVMTSLVQHLHAFAREVKLTEGEWMKGIEFLTRVGHITDAKRQEFILLSDVLGLSMLTVAMNNDKRRAAPRPPCSALSTWKASPASISAKTLPRARRAFPARCAARSAASSGEPVPAPRSTSGRPMPKASTTCSARARRPPGARRAACQRQGQLPLPLHPGRGLSDPRRRPGRRHAEGDQAPSLAAGAPALHDQGAGLRDADHARVPQRRPVSRFRRRVRRAPVAGGRLGAAAGRQVPGRIRLRAESARCCSWRSACCFRPSRTIRCPRAAWARC